MKVTECYSILLGAVYGLFYRSLCGVGGAQMYQFDLYSISFLFLLPAIIGCIPLLLSPKSVLKARWKLFAFPSFSVVLFFIFVIATGWEDTLCILILGFPYFITAGIAGLIMGRILQYYPSKKLLLIALLPFIFQPIEQSFPRQEKRYRVEQNVVIKADPEQTWSLLIEVPEITEEEYEAGFYQWLGVPRPIKSQLEQRNEKTYRIGYFSKGMELCESIVARDSLHFVEFEVHLDRSKLLNRPTHQHLLQSGYFQFQAIRYELEPHSKNTTQLSLICEYTIDSHLNGYGQYWAHAVLRDFEMRLLKVLKQKAEHKN